MASVRRNLRHTNTCPSAQNPLKTNKTPNPLAQLLPYHIAQHLSSHNNLTCSHIIGLPTLNYQSTPEQALAEMQRAAKWQSEEVGGLKVFEEAIKKNEEPQTAKQIKTSQVIAEEAIKQVKSQQNEQYNQALLVCEFRDYGKNCFDFRQFNHNSEA